MGKGHQLREQADNLDSKLGRNCSPGVGEAQHENSIQSPTESLGEWAIASHGMYESRQL